MNNDVLVLLVSIVLAFLGLVLTWLRTRKSKLEKDYLKAVKGDLCELYVIEINGIYYSINDVRFVKLDTISEEDYLLHKYKGKDGKYHG